jgi:hypothetical protein
MLLLPYACGKEHIPIYHRISSLPAVTVHVFSDIVNISLQCYNFDINMMRAKRYILMVTYGYSYF